MLRARRRSLCGHGDLRRCRNTWGIRQRGHVAVGVRPPTCAVHRQVAEVVGVRRVFSGAGAVGEAEPRGRWMHGPRCQIRMRSRV